MMVSNLIRELREARLMTRPQLAQHARISRAHLWSIENGRIVPGISTLEKLSEVLGVEVGRFLKSDSEMLLEDPFVQSIRPLLPRLSDASRKQILKVVHAAPQKRKNAR